MDNPPQTIEPIAGILKRGAVLADDAEPETLLQYLGRNLMESVERGILRLRNLQLRNRRCRVCNNLDPQGHPKSTLNDNGWRLAVLDITLSRLLRSCNRRRGECQFCLLLAMTIVTLLPECTELFRVSVLLLQAGNPILMFITDDLSDKKQDLWRLEMYIPIGNHSPLLTLGNAAEVPDHAGSESTFSFIADCLGRCTNSHSICQQHQATYFPRRVIDLGSDNSKIRLFERRDEDIPVRYVTLSHCWGGFQPLATTHGTINDRKRNIEWHLLPKLFQDAVTVCRRFDIQYLWIDSLCIIQNCVADWEMESAKMADVYENAFFTIAAVSSPNSNTPFLVPRQPEERLHTIEIDCQVVTGQPGSINARLTSSGWSPEVCHGPLSTRAWAWQERQLSVRIMQFTTTEVKWHCATEDRCECTTSPPVPKGTSWKDDPDTYNRWHQLVGSYTTRKMTNISDKLPALSGVASRFQKNTQTEYMAGLWKDNLKLDLLWARKDSAPLSRPLKTRYQSPSWSWASIEGQVNYLFVDDVDTLISVKYASCSLASPNMFGEVNGGSVIISGLATRINLTATDPLDADSYTLNHNHYSRPMFPDCILVEGIGQAMDWLPVTTVQLLVGGTEEERDPLPVDTVQRASIDETIQAEFGPINRLVWCVFGCVIELSVGEASVKVLILGESATAPGTFERLGLASIPRHRAHKWSAGATMRQFTII